MGSLVLNSESVDSDIYLTLGLKELGDGVSGSPWILTLLSSLLESSVQKNEMLLKSTKTKDVVTLFHGLRAPSISIQQYIDRIFKYSGCSPSCFIIAHIYVDRFLQETDVHLTSLNVHRLLITSVMVAAKFIDDAFFNNAYYARIGGVNTEELNRMEVKFLFSLDFRLHVSVETFKRYCYQLERESPVLLQIERPIRACSIKDSWSNSSVSTCAATIAR
ncbi:Cyclin domain-containing protein [Cephalotus follicularis]|uniref:Cyclin domain-containing protein n=1 Tax=Cephalotus follicularis TaxID=3775 RepID=A0A1Q3APX4_CEPFO|nr:Cyclin domain-containing protein [Cephalotus follicularis]